MSRKRMTFVVEGCGSWSEEYLKGLERLRRELRESGEGEVGAYFTYDSTFGLVADFDEFPLAVRADGLRYLNERVERYRSKKFECFDTFDSRRGAVVGRGEPGHARIGRQRPTTVDAVFVVTPDSWHLRTALSWVGQADMIFVEKPLDVSEHNVAEFVGEFRRRHPNRKIYEGIRPLDHYAVRLDYALRNHEGFRRYLTHDVVGNLVGPVSSFEFVMTEGKSEEDARFDRTRARAPSIQKGMIFDMASHAFPMLFPWLNITQAFQITALRAGVSTRYAKEILVKGAESFSAVEVETTMQDGFGVFSGLPVRGRIIVGKDVGEHDNKYVRITGQQGSIRIGLADPYPVTHEHDGSVVQLDQLSKEWAYYLLKGLWERRHAGFPDAGYVAGDFFQFRAARRTVQHLERWASLVQREGEPLPEYEPGTPLAELLGDGYLLMEEA